MYDWGLNPMTSQNGSPFNNGGMYEILLAASGSITLNLPRGAISFMIDSAGLAVYVYAGNNAEGQKFVLMSGGKQPITIENFMGGQYTFEEPTGGATATLRIWAQGLVESV